MAKSWQPSKRFKGVRFYIKNEKLRLPGNRLDRCWGIRYAVSGKKYESILGWTSEGWTEQKAADKRQYYIHNAKTAEGPASPREEAILAEKACIAYEKAEKAAQYQEMPFKDYTEIEYFPVALTSIKAKTAKDYKDQARIWIYPVVGDLSFKDIGLHEVQKIKSKLSKAGRAPRTIQAVFRTFTAIWYGAMDAGLTNERPPTKRKGFKLPKFDNKRRRFLTFAEADALLAAVQKRSGQAYKLSLLSLHTGMRWGEIQSLKWQAIQLDQNVLHVLDGKGDKSRTLEMDATVRKMLENMIKEKPGNYVFPGRYGGPMSGVPSSFKRAVNDIGLNDGVTDKKIWISFHSLRHTYASWLRKSGAGLATIQEILGHSTIQVTERYAHVEHREIKNAVTALDQMLEAAKTEDNKKVVPFKKKA